MLSSNMDSVISSPMEEAEDSSSSATIGVAAATPAPSHRNRHESHRLPPLTTIRRAISRPRPLSSRPPPRPIPREDHDDGSVGQFVGYDGCVCVEGLEDSFERQCCVSQVIL